MKVLLITGSFPPMRCGVGDYTHQLAHALARAEGLEVAVLTSTTAQAPHSNGGFTLLPIAKSWSIGEVGSILKGIRAFDPDVVHIQFPTQGFGPRLLPWLLPLVCHLAGFTIAQTWHEYYRRVGPRLSLRLLCTGLAPGGLVVVRANFKQMTLPQWRWSFRNKLMRFIASAPSIPRANLAAEERQVLRESLGCADKQLIVYFGFMYPPKGVEQLFEIAEPGRHRLVLIGEVNPADPYHASLMRLAAGDSWGGKVTVTGFLPAPEVARIIAAADGVVLPFRDGGGGWNTSIQAAQAQGTFVLTTSRQQHGYVAAENTYFANPDEVAEMRAALARHASQRNSQPQVQTWERIAAAHRDLYEDLRAGTGGESRWKRPA